MDFKNIYELYFKDVYLFVLSLSRNPDLAEEITQETFFKAMKNLRQFKNDCSVKTWLCQIAKNLYFTHTRKRHFHASFDEIDTSGYLDSPETLFSQKEETLSIYKILHYLEEPYKEVFTLRVLGDLSYKEIAEIFDHKENWARVTFHRAKMKLRELIDQKEV